MSDFPDDSHDPICANHGGCDLMVWSVVYSNYEPAEVHSLWSSKEGAESQADVLDGPWEVHPTMIHRGTVRKPGLTPGQAQ
jgi:hypothetical protein